MPKSFTIFDLELGGVEDCDGRTAESVYGVTEVSFANVRVSDDWSRTDLVEFFHSFVKPRPELCYDDGALNVQTTWLEDCYRETFDPTDFVGNCPACKGAGETEADGVVSDCPACSGMTEPNAADTLYAWLLCNGRDEARVCQGLFDWAVHHNGYELYKVSAWSHNINTDMAFLQAMFWRCFPDEYEDRENGRTHNMMPCNRAGRCSMILFRCMRDVGLHDRYKANLDTIIAFYGITVPEIERHTAKGDILALGAAIGCMLQHIKTGKKFGNQGQEGLF